MIQGVHALFCTRSDSQRFGQLCDLVVHGSVDDMSRGGDTRRIRDTQSAPALSTSTPRSAVDHLLCGLRIPSPFDFDLGGSTLDILEVADGEFDRGRRDVLF